MENKKGSILCIAILFIVLFDVPVCAEYKEFVTGDYREEYRHGGYDAGYDPDYNCNEIDDQEVKYIINENFTYTRGSDIYLDSDHIPSGWDVRTNGGRVQGNYYYSDWKMIDTSSDFPVEATRKFEKLTFGMGTLQFVFLVENEIDGLCWELYQDQQVVTRIVSRNSKLFLEAANREFIEISDLLTNQLYGVRIDFDIDNDLINAIYVNGKLCKENQAFINKALYINSFNINTGAQAVGTLSMRTVQLSRGYMMHEQFISTVGQNIPQDFKKTVINDADVSIGTADSNTYPDIYYLKLIANNGQASVEKKIDNSNERIIVKYSVLAYEKSGTFEVNLIADDKKAICFSSNGGSFLINGNRFYDYKEKVWYYVKLDIDLKNKTFDMYLNNKLKVENAKIDASTIDSFVIDVLDGAELWVDEIVIQKYITEPADYVPKPIPVNNPDIQLGMQFCPMWENGSHRGWDSINADKDRLPYLGYYDEGSPEVADWIIKQLLEHGFSYIKVAWCGGANNVDFPHTAFMGGEFLNGFLQAKYSNMMKFMILWENIAMGSSADKLVNVVGPYWIEHYFKDDRYLKINERPVIGFLSLDAYIEGSGNDFEVAKKGLDAFKQVCIVSGVGEPIYVFSEVSTDASTYKKYKDLGIEVIQPYGAATGTVMSQDRFHKSVDMAVRESGLTFSPTFGSGYDGRAWNSTSSGYVPNEMFRAFLETYRDDFFKNADKTKPMWNYVMFDTYDELGEGHYILPCGRCGWDLFDIIRETFVGDDEHEDIVPTMKQKDRFNNLYPYAREVIPIESGETIADFSDLEVKKGWYFDTQNDFEGWKNGGHISGLRIENGCIAGTASGVDPMIISNEVIDTRDISYVKIRIKTKGPVKSGQVFFATQKEPFYSEAKSDFFRVYSDDFEDVYMCIGANEKWTDTMTSLRVDALNMNYDYVNSGCEFYIDSIELLGKDVPQPFKILGTSFDNPDKVGIISEMTVTFNKKPGVSAMDISNYVVEGGNQKVIGANIVDNSVILTFNELLSENTRYTLVMNDLKDTDGNELEIYKNIISFTTVAEVIYRNSFSNEADFNRPSIKESTTKNGDAVMIQTNSVTELFPFQNDSYENLQLEVGKTYIISYRACVPEGSNFNQMAIVNIDEGFFIQWPINDLTTQMQTYTICFEAKYANPLDERQTVSAPFFRFWSKDSSSSAKVIIDDIVLYSQETFALGDIKLYGNYATHAQSEITGDSFSGERITAVFKDAFNYSGKQKELSLVIAAYENNVLKEVNMCKAKLGDTQNLSDILIASVGVLDDNGVERKIKVFLWDGTLMEPLKKERILNS